MQSEVGPEGNEKGVIVKQGFLAQWNKTVFENERLLHIYTEL
jgi:hypothetical protein